MTSPVVDDRAERAEEFETKSADQAAAPVLGDILRRARNHGGLTLREVEQRIGIANAHLSQIERGSIKRPDPALLADLSDLYGLDFRLMAEWVGYLDSDTKRNVSQNMAAAALRVFVSLDAVEQRSALQYLEALREGTRD